MRRFGDYFLHKEYTKIEGLGSKLGLIRDIIEWEKFRPIIRDMYHDNKETGGRPYTDEILMIKILLLPGWQVYLIVISNSMQQTGYHFEIFLDIRRKYLIA